MIFRGVRDTIGAPLTHKVEGQVETTTFVMVSNRPWRRGVLGFGILWDLIAGQVWSQMWIETKNMIRQDIKRQNHDT